MFEQSPFLFNQRCPLSAQPFRTPAGVALGQSSSTANRATPGLPTVATPHSVGLSKEQDLGDRRVASSSVRPYGLTAPGFYDIVDDETAVGSEDVRLLSERHGPEPSTARPLNGGQSHSGDPNRTQLPVSHFLNGDPFHSDARSSDAFGTEKVYTRTAKEGTHPDGDTSAAARSLDSLSKKEPPLSTHSNAFRDLSCSPQSRHQHDRNITASQKSGWTQAASSAPRPSDTDGFLNDMRVQCFDDDDEELSGLLDQKHATAGCGAKPYLDWWQLTDAQQKHSDQLQAYIAQEQLQGVNRIRSQLSQAAQVFRELAHLINQQDDDIDRLDQSIVNAKGGTSSAIKELRKANQLKQRARRRTLFMIGVTCVAALVVVLVYLVQYAPPGIGAASSPSVALTPQAPVAPLAPARGLQPSQVPSVSGGASGGLPKLEGVPVAEASSVARKASKLPS